ncbi:Eco57I restriction-modification methylase domain-containing protein [Lacticaseibacillus paracasei]|uniref:Eco57I restriction-modification methylase domain-containing protein n=1 Tax=Lacticaseibacillus paracasei TaxID=1597 RepID=UPI0021A8738A|nr:Eco57I restriction-modification methylase domain-containing protein [Lacticaseibacillus paracasei]
MATSLYYQEFQKLNEVTAGKFSAQDLEDLWADILDQNIFAVAKTPMAKTIAERTLTGYKNYDTHIVYVDNIVETARQSIDAGVKKIEEAFKYMKFDVVIGNPPYQEQAAGTNTKQPSIYNYFMDLSYGLAQKAVLITPAKFLSNAGDTPKSWNEKMLHDSHLRIVHYEQNSANIFPNTDIKGGVVVTLRDATQNFGEIGIFTPLPELQSILKKVTSMAKQSFNEIAFSSTSYKFSDRLLQDHPDPKFSSQVQR